MYLLLTKPVVRLFKHWLNVKCKKINAKSKVLQIHELSEDDCLLAIITKAGLGNQSLMTDRQLTAIM